MTAKHLTGVADMGFDVGIRSQGRESSCCQTWDLFHQGSCFRAVTAVALELLTKGIETKDIPTTFVDVGFMSRREVGLTTFCFVVEEVLQLLQNVLPILFQNFKKGVSHRANLIAL